MPAVARLDDPIEGMTAGEHSGHTMPSHSPCEITGKIDGNCSPNVFVNGKPVAFVSSTTEEFDCCCAGGSGVVSSGSSTVFVNGNAVARVDDDITPHNGTAKITGGSDNVFAG